MQTVVSLYKIPFLFPLRFHTCQTLTWFCSIHTNFTCNTKQNHFLGTMPENKRNLLEKRARQSWQHVYKAEPKQMKTVKSLLFNHSSIFDILSSDKPHEHSLVLRKKQPWNKNPRKSGRKYSLALKESQCDFEDGVYVHVKYPTNGFSSGSRGHYLFEVA